MKGRHVILAFVVLLTIASVLSACGSSPASTPTSATSAATTAPAATSTKPPATTAPAATPTKPAVTPAVAAATSTTGGNIDAGKAVFATSCNVCHPNGGAGVGPDLKGKTADAVNKIVRTGSGAMPAIAADKVSDQQLNDIVAYVTSLK